MMSTRIYFPMTGNILTAGHIKCLEWLSERGVVILGLLSPRALKGYKREVVPYEDRAYIMFTVAAALKNVLVVRQDSLDPKANYMKYKCNALASGDGWEPIELDFIKRYNVKRIDIKLPGEKSKKYSSTKILEGYENRSYTRSIRDH